MARSVLISCGARLADNKNSFELDRLIRRRRPPKPSELCVVYEVDVPEGFIGEDEDILNYDDLDTF